MSIKLYAAHLLDESCKVPDGYNNETLKDVFFEGNDASIRHGLRHCWAQKPQTDLNDIA